VYFNDLKNVFGKPKGKLQIIIQQGSSIQTAFRLRNYEEGGELIDAFATVDDVVFAGYDKEMFGDHHDEE